MPRNSPSRAALEDEAAPDTDLDLPEEIDEDEAAAEPWRPTLKRPLQVAVVGRPNAGKSTLINRILGEERLLTGPEAGITRDAISVPVTWDGVPMRIFDTAGDAQEGARCRRSWKSFRSPTGCAR